MRHGERVARGGGRKLWVRGRKVANQHGGFEGYRLSNRTVFLHRHGQTARSGRPISLIQEAWVSSPTSALYYFYTPLAPSLLRSQRQYHPCLSPGVLSLCLNPISQMPRRQAHTRFAELCLARFTMAWIVRLIGWAVSRSVPGPVVDRNREVRATNIVRVPQPRAGMEAQPSGRRPP